MRGLGIAPSLGSGPLLRRALMGASFLGAALATAVCLLVRCLPVVAERMGAWRGSCAVEPVLGATPQPARAVLDVVLSVCAVTATMVPGESPSSVRVETLSIHSSLTMLPSFLR